MRDFRQLQVWEKSHALVLAVYASTQRLPKEEMFGLTSQIRRAVVSIPANIAEGCGKEGDPEFRRYLLIAMGSASELEYLLMLAHDLKYLEDANYQSLQGILVETRRMLNSLIMKVKPSKHLALGG